MSKHEPRLVLEQIVQFADEIAEMVGKREREDLDRHREFGRALERCVELIGEAATRLPPNFLEKHPGVPWRQIIGMRNVMIHGYDVVSSDVLWDTAAHDVPELRLKVRAILEAG